MLFGLMRACVVIACCSSSCKTWFFGLPLAVFCNAEGRISRGDMRPSVLLWGRGGRADEPDVPDKPDWPNMKKEMYYSLFIIHFSFKVYWIFHCSFLIFHFQSVCLQPVRAPSAVGHEGNVERICALHLLQDYALHALPLVGIDAEVKFVVHL